MKISRGEAGVQRAYFIVKASRSPYEWSASTNTQKHSLAVSRVGTQQHTTAKGRVVLIGELNHTSCSVAKKKEDNKSVDR